MCSGCGNFFLTQIFVDVLNWIFSWVGNYGWSVIIFTLFIKLILLPLDIKSRKSMRAMSMLNPQIEVLRKRYQNDQEKLNRKTQELYRDNHVSPFSGCLPILLQMPILFIMFYAMREVAAQQQVKMAYEWMINSGLASSELVDGQVVLNWSRLAEIQTGIGSTSIDFEQYFNPQQWLWIKSVFQADNMNRFVLPTVTELETTLKGYGDNWTSGDMATYKAFVQAYIQATGLSTGDRISAISSILGPYEGSEGLLANITAFIQGTDSELTLSALTEALGDIIKDGNELAFVSYLIQPTATLDADTLSSISAYLSENQTIDASVKQLISYMLEKRATSVTFGSFIDTALASTTSSYSGSILGLISIEFPTRFNRYINGYFILPILACATQVLSTKLQPNSTETQTPATTDSNAQNPTASTGKVMKWVFPIMSLWICWTSTAAFAIYWVFVNIWSIVSSYGINLYLTNKEKNGTDKPSKPKKDNSKNTKEALQP